MEFLLGCIFVFLVSISIGLALYFRGKTGIENRPPELGTYIQENARLAAELASLQKRFWELTQELQSEKSERDQLAGRGKQLFVEITTLKEKYDTLSKEKEWLLQDLTRFQAEDIQKQREFDRKIAQLDEARNALEDEKKRIRKEDEEQAIYEKENRDRMWAEHEERVKSYLGELSRLPQYNFQSYDNKHLPEGFGGKFKPDFMIEFLGQYVIFDAKVSKSDNLQSYVSTNVKSTADKINNDSRIYPMVFFVVPTEAIALLAKTHFQEQGYEFFIISPEAIPVILAAFKRISAYELAEQLDPRERENIVTLIAEFDHHINMRNALDIIASQTGVTVLSKIQNLQKNLQTEIQHKKSNIRIAPPSSLEIKTLMVDTDKQQTTINTLTAPQSDVSLGLLDS